LLRGRQVLGPGQEQRPGLGDPGAHPRKGVGEHLGVELQGGLGVALAALLRLGPKAVIVLPTHPHPVVQLQLEVVLAKEGQLLAHHVHELLVRGADIAARVAIDDGQAVGGSQGLELPPARLEHGLDGEGVGGIDLALADEIGALLVGVASRLVVAHHVGAGREQEPHAELTVGDVDHLGRAGQEGAVALGGPGRHTIEQGPEHHGIIAKSA